MNQAYHHFIFSEEIIPQVLREKIVREVLRAGKEEESSPIRDFYLRAIKSTSIPGFRPGKEPPTELLIIHFMKALKSSRESFGDVLSSWRCLKPDLYDLVSSHVRLSPEERDLLQKDNEVILAAGRWAKEIKAKEETKHTEYEIRLMAALKLCMMREEQTEHKENQEEQENLGRWQSLLKEVKAWPGAAAEWDQAENFMSELHQLTKTKKKERIDAKKELEERLERLKKKEEDIRYFGLEDIQKWQSSALFTVRFDKASCKLTALEEHLDEYQHSKNQKFHSIDERRKIAARLEDMENHIGSLYEDLAAEFTSIEEQKTKHPQGKEEQPADKTAAEPEKGRTFEQEDRLSLTDEAADKKASEKGTRAESASFEEPDKAVIEKKQEEKVIESKEKTEDGQGENHKKEDHFALDDYQAAFYGEEQWAESCLEQDQDTPDENEEKMREDLIPDFMPPREVVNASELFGTQTSSAPWCKVEAEADEKTSVPDIDAGLSFVQAVDEWVKAEYGSLENEEESRPEETASQEEIKPSSTEQNLRETIGSRKDRAHSPGEKKRGLFNRLRSRLDVINASELFPSDEEKEKTKDPLANEEATGAEETSKEAAGEPKEDLSAQKDGLKKTANESFTEEEKEKIQADEKRATEKLKTEHQAKEPKVKEEKAADHSEETTEEKETSREIVEAWAEDKTQSSFDQNDKNDELDQEQKASSLAEEASLEEAFSKEREETTSFEKRAEKQETAKTPDQQEESQEGQPEAAEEKQRADQQAPGKIDLTAPKDDDEATASEHVPKEKTLDIRQIEMMNSLAEVQGKSNENKSLEESRKKRQERLEEVQEKVKRAASERRITESDKEKYLHQLASLPAADEKEADRLDALLADIEEELKVDGQERFAELKARWQQVKKKIERDANFDSEEKKEFIIFVDQEIANKNSKVIEACLNKLTERLREEKSDEKDKSCHDEREMVHRTYIKQREQIQSYLSRHEKPYANLEQAIKQKQPLTGIDYHKMSAAHLDQIKSVLSTWAQLKQQKPLGADSLFGSRLKSILSFAGFSLAGGENSFANIRDEKGWRMDRVRMRLGDEKDPSSCSTAEEVYHVVCIWGQTEDPVRIVEELDEDKTNVVICYLGRLHPLQRRRIFKMVRKQKTPVGILDEPLLIYLTGVPAQRHQIFSYCSFPPVKSFEMKKKSS